MNVLIVESRFHPAIAEALTDGATKALQLGGAHFTRAQVPGILEIPAAIALGARADRFDGYVALGSMVRTGTAHFELITDNVFYGLTRLGTDHALCIGNGIVVATTEDAALQMALKEERDVGGDAARACLAMIALAKRLGEQS
ncbi:MAG: 6,7-dimethyl-8-ribityllumazine synthase [Alphaproteobacteria bacterium]|nr:6,7-dimethyl-8-ribityllumazine synthase [Alphaproteobacteria bacterium]